MAPLIESGMLDKSINDAALSRSYQVGFFFSSVSSLMMVNESGQCQCHSHKTICDQYYDWHEIHTKVLFWSWGQAS